MEAKDQANAHLKSLTERTNNFKQKYQSIDVFWQEKQSKQKMCVWLSPYNSTGKNQ